MSLHVLRNLALAACCIATAQAAVVSGTFQGIAFNSRIAATSPTPGDFDGSVVTGRFRFDSGGVLPPEDDLPIPDSAHARWRYLQAGALQLAFEAVGEPAVFAADDGSWNAALFWNEPGNQYIAFLPDQGNPYLHAELRLYGALFDGVDPGSVRAGPVDLATSYASFFYGRDFGADVRLTQVVLDGQAVPEPAGMLLVATLLGALAWSRRHSRPA